MPSYLPTLAIPMDAVFVSDICGFVLALPIALFMAYWMSAVKNRWIVVLGAFIGDVIGFLIILGWLGTLIFSTPYPGAEANGTAIFFGALLLNSVLGLSGGMIFDLLVARSSRRDYRRREPVHQ
jgi:hypothetical protein